MRVPNTVRTVAEVIGMDAAVRLLAAPGKNQCVYIPQHIKPGHRRFEQPSRAETHLRRHDVRREVGRPTQATGWGQDHRSFTFQPCADEGGSAADEHIRRRFAGLIVIIITLPSPPGSPRRAFLCKVLGRRFADLQSRGTIDLQRFERGTLHFAPKSERKTYRRHARVRERVRVCASERARVYLYLHSHCKVSSKRWVFPLIMKGKIALQSILQREK